MKNTPLLYVLLAVVIGVASAGATTLFLTQSNSRAANSGDLEAALAPGAEVVSPADFQRLAESVERLRERILDLEARPEREITERIALSESTNDDFEAEVRAFMAAMKSGESASEASVPKVAEALELIREEERAIQERKWEEQRIAKEEAGLAKLATQLDLSGWQTDEFRTLMTNRRLANEDLAQRWKAGEDPELLGQEKEANRQANEDAVARVLSPQQLESYRALRAERSGK